MESGELGKIYTDTQIIVKQGELGDCMYVIQEGLVKIVRETDRGEVLLSLRGKGEFFGEMAIFERKARSATVRALGEARGSARTEYPGVLHEIQRSDQG